MLWTLLLILAAVVLDQWTKYLAAAHLQEIETLPLWQDIFHFTYVENRGAAFGMLANHRWVFMIFSTVAILLVLGWLFWEKPKSAWVKISAAFIIGGGIGNMIDRIRLGYVIDFIDVRAIRFYVFNVADSFVCVGCAMMLLWVLCSEWQERKKARQSPPMKEQNESSLPESQESAHE